MISISALLDDGRTGKMNMILCDEALRYLSACLQIFYHCCRSGPLNHLILLLFFHQHADHDSLVWTAASGGSGSASKEQHLLRIIS